MSREEKRTDFTLFLPLQENHHLPPFLGIFSFMMFSNVAWGGVRTAQTSMTQYH